MEDNKITSKTIDNNEDSILKIEGYIREHLNSLSDNILNLCNNEYTKRWRRNNKEKVRLYNLEYYKNIYKP